MTFSLVVPIRNERATLHHFVNRLRETMHALQGQSCGEWEIILCDAGSDDGSEEIVMEAARDNGWKTVKCRMANPSVGRTVSEAVKETRGEFIVVLPSDCYLSPGALKVFNEELDRRHILCGGFAKRYRPTNLWLDFYAQIQNRIRMEWFRHLVWTNGIFFHRTMARELRTVGFMEDVLFSDQLRRMEGWVALRSVIEVSSRRYLPGRCSRQIVLNAFILLAFRLRLLPLPWLRIIYNGQK